MIPGKHAVLPQLSSKFTKLQNSSSFVTLVYFCRLQNSINLINSTKMNL